MSYILDALKKSTKERNHGESEDLYIVHGRAPTFSKTRWVKDKEKGWILLGIFFVLIVCSATYIYWYEEAALPEKSSGRIVITKDIDIRSQLDSFEATTNSELEERDGTQPPVVVENNPYTIPVIRRNAQKIVLTPTKSELEEIAQQNVSRSSAIIERKDLPPELQLQIPPMKFAGHTYADEPKQRMIIINNKILREGDRIDENTKLVEIIWEGVILEYKGAVFKQQLN